MVLTSSKMLTALVKRIFSLKLMVAIVAAALWLTVSVHAQSTADAFKPYRSAAGGFKLKYPQDWSTSAADKGNSLVVVFTSPTVRDDDVFQAATIMVCSTPIDETAWNDCTERDSHLAELHQDKVRSRKEFLVSGLKSEIVETSSKYNDAFFYYARFSSPDRKFFVRGNFKKSFNLDRYAPVFEKMLGSFRLL